MITQSSDGTKYTNLDDYNKGYDALIAYHNVALTKYPNVYKLSLTQLIKTLSARTGQSFFVQGLGGAIDLSEMSKSEAKQAMEILAQKSGGKIPATNGAFYTALIDEASSTNWIDASTFTMVESAKQIVKGSVAVGDKILDAGEEVLDSAVSISKNLEWLIPLIAVGGAFIYISGMKR